jgi:hypothetical protein
MKTDNQNWDNNNQPRKTEKQPPQQPDQSDQNKNKADKKSVYIKDMPPIDGARPGVI